MGFLHRAVRLAKGGRRTTNGHVSACSRPVVTSSAECSPSRDDPGSLLALLFQRRRHRRGGAARHAGGGEILDGPLDMPGGSWIVRCPTRRAPDSRWKGRAARAPVGYFERRRAILAAGRRAPDRVRASARLIPARPSVGSPDCVPRPSANWPTGPSTWNSIPVIFANRSIWCSRSRIRRVPCRSPSGRASESTRRHPSGSAHRRARCTSMTPGRSAPRW